MGRTYSVTSLGGSLVGAVLAQVTGLVACQRRDVRDRPACFAQGAYTGNKWEFPAGDRQWPGDRLFRGQGLDQSDGAVRYGEVGKGMRRTKVLAVSKIVSGRDVLVGRDGNG
jgi:hypothetical protein